MIKDFIKEGTIYAVASVAAKGISLMLIPVFTLYFATKDFGVIEILYVFSSLVSGVLSWQLGQALLRYLGEHQFDEKRKKYISSTALVLIVLSYSLGTLLLIFFRNEFCTWLGLNAKSHERTFILAMIVMAMNGIFLFLGSHLQGLRFKRSVAITQFLHAILGISLTYFFVIVLNKSVNGIFYAAIVVFPVVILTQLWALREEFAFQFSKTISKNLLKYSVPIIPAALALVAFSLTDRILLNFFHGAEKLGIYSVAFKFAFGLQLIISGYSLAIHPIVFQKYKDETTKTKLGKLLVGYTLTGATCVFLLSLFATETMHLFTQPAYYSGIKILPLLYTATWVNGFVMFAPGMQLSKRTIWISVIICSALIVNVLLGYFMIPTLGIRGAAIANLIGTCAYVTGLFLLSLKFYPYKFPKQFLTIFFTGTVGFAIVLSLFFTYFENHINLSSKVSLSFILVSVLLFYFLISFQGEKEKSLTQNKSVK